MPLIDPPLFVRALTLLAILGSARAEQDPPPGQTEFQRVLASFGQINTIAGRGFADNCNGWNANMEAGPAMGAELSRPHMAQADAAGNVYIADKEAHSIRLVKPDGTIHTIAGNGTRGDGGEGVATNIPMREPNGLFTFPDGTTYILETDDQCDVGPLAGGKIRRLGTDGMLTTIIDDPNLLAGRGLWVNADESLIYYCSLNAVKRWTETAGLEDFATGFTELGNLDIDPLSGQVCVTDRGIHRVYRISSDGTTKTVIAGNGEEGSGAEGSQATQCALEQVRGIAFRPDGSFFVCTHKGDHAVWFVDTAGLIWKLIDGQNNAHSGDGFPISDRPQNMISEPRAVTIAPNGDLLITERDEGHVRRVTNICIEPVITSIELQAETATLTWTSHREGNYRLEGSEDLSDWQPILDADTGQGPISSATVDRIDPRQFFRVASD